LRAILDRDGLAGVRIDRLDVYEIPAGEMHPCCASHSPHGQQAQAAAADAEPITEPGEMRRELARTRERGWAINDEEIEIGLRSIAVPFRDRSGATCAAVNVSAPAARLGRAVARLAAGPATRCRCDRPVDDASLMLRTQGKDGEIRRKRLIVPQGGTGHVPSPAAADR